MPRPVLSEALIHPSVRDKVAQHHQDLITQVQAAIAANAVVVVGIGVTALSAALSWGPLHAWSWLGLPTRVGVWAALALAASYAAPIGLGVWHGNTLAAILMQLVAQRADRDA